ncbi:MAG: HAD family hydrolase [Dehalococcoidia bacterium]
MTFRAVLFDVGGPIDTEVQHEKLVDEYLRRALLEVGVHVTDQAFQAASDWAIHAFAPHAYESMLWKLCRGDQQRTRDALAVFAGYTAERRQRRGGIELRPGIGEVIRDLHDRGLGLGLAANQPASVIEQLDGFGLVQYFSHREVSGHHGFRKPDTRLFLRACADLEVEPGECIMVGDRIDNDIFPARVLGMGTVLFRTGRHIEQRPRSLAEIPHEEVHSTAELAAALERMLAR